VNQERETTATVPDLEEQTDLSGFISDPLLQGEHGHFAQVEVVWQIFLRAASSAELP
jgi:hypothetical protein